MYATIIMCLETIECLKNVKQNNVGKLWKSYFFFDSFWICCKYSYFEQLFSLHIIGNLVSENSQKSTDYSRLLEIEFYPLTCICNAFQI